MDIEQNEIDRLLAVSVLNRKKNWKIFLFTGVPMQLTMSTVVFVAGLTARAGSILLLPKDLYYMQEYSGCLPQHINTKKILHCLFWQTGLSNTYLTTLSIKSMVVFTGVFMQAEPHRLIDS